jgi:hypothetical protein
MQHGQSQIDAMMQWNQATIDMRSQAKSSLMQRWLRAPHRLLAVLRQRFRGSSSCDQ